MRHLTRAISAVSVTLLLVGAGCASTEVSQLTTPTAQQKAVMDAASARRIDAPDVRFGDPIGTSVHSTLRYADGLQVELLEISDTRCKPAKPEDKCPVPGEASATVQLQGGDMPAPTKVVVSSVHSPLARSNGYVVVLQDVTATFARLTVSKQQVAGSPAVPQPPRPSAARPTPVTVPHQAQANGEQAAPAAVKFTKPAADSASAATAKDDSVIGQIVDAWHALYDSIFGSSASQNGVNGSSQATVPAVPAKKSN